MSRNQRASGSGTGADQLPREMNEMRIRDDSNLDDKVDTRIESKDLPFTKLSSSSLQFLYTLSGS